MKLKIAICAVTKNNNLNEIKEWVEWYKNLGIDNIFLYNDNYDKEEINKEYINNNFVKVIDVIQNNKLQCYIEFYEGLGKDFDWICFFDINEFLTFRDSLNIQSFLIQDKFINQDLILISSQNDNHYVKSIVRSNKNILNKEQINLEYIFRLENDNTVYSNGLKIKDNNIWYNIPHKIHIIAPCYLDIKNKQYDNQLNSNLFGVSICLSAYKTSEYIEECLDSINNQTWFNKNKNYEILLGIDSCQETLNKVQQIKYKYNNLRIFMMDSNVGTYIVANTIMSLAKYNILIRFDTDDIMRPDMVEKIVNNFYDCEIITYNYQNFGDQNNSGWACGSHALSKKIFNKYGGYQAWRCAADYDFLVRMNGIVKDKHLNLTYLRRVHKNSLEFSEETNMKSKIRQEYHNYIKTETKQHRIINCIKSSYKEIYNNIYNSSGKIYNNEKAIISLTSWKKRINNVHLTLENILSLCPNYHIVLVLSQEEFPNKELELPQSLINLVNNNKIELLWVYKNYKAFKKILFTMDKYKNIPIISADDDCIYKWNYADDLYNLWINHPEFNHFFPRHNKMVTGCGACSLYSPYCFKNAKDLLNDNIIDTLEDDMFYQYLIDKLQLKQYYMVDKWPFSQVNNNDSLSEKYHSILSPPEKKLKYYNIYDKYVNLNLLINYNNSYPKNYNKPIISFTSYKDRLPYICDVIKSILNNTIKPYKIILNLYKDDVKYITRELHKLIYHNIVELYICDLDIRPHKKYYYTMLRYKDNPIITIDDDVIYPSDFIESLINSYKKYPNCVSGRRVHKIKYKNDGTIDLVKNWILSYNKIIDPSFDITHSGVGGVLYPPDILKISEKCLPDILEYISVDDKYILYLEKYLGIKTVYVPNNKNHPDPIKELIPTGLCYTENEIGEYTKNDICINELINKRLINKKKFELNKFNYIPQFNQFGNIINTDELKTAINIHANKMIGKLNLDNPQLIYEKLNWLKIYDVSYLKSNCADKIKIHKYCKDKLGKDICIPIIKIYNSPDEIDLNELPNQFVLKCNHGYKMNIICKDKSLFNLEQAKIYCKKWLNYDFGHETLQYQYSLIDRKCFIEEYMTNGDHGLTDYKIWCQNGIPYFIMVINDRFNGINKIHANVYDLNWNFIELGWRTFPSNKNLLDKKPKTFDKMIEYAKKLSEDFKFVRVDFYEINGQCYLGELTFTPDNGFFHFNKDKEIELGNKLLL